MTMGRGRERKNPTGRMDAELDGPPGRFSRRRFVAGGLALSALAFLPGCGGDDEEDPTATSEPETANDPTATPEPETVDDPTLTPEPATAVDPTEAPDATATSGSEAQSDPTMESNTGSHYPITLEHALGETTIPELPERIVVVQDTEPLDCLLAIGLEPVLYGYTDGYSLGRLPSWVDISDEVESFDNREREPDLELIAAASPDLILDTWTMDDTYEQLSNIAPTLVLKNTDTALWQDIQRLVGQATDREQQAEEAIAETEALFPEQAARLEEHAGKTVSIAYKFFDDLLINGANVAIGRLVEQLGLTVVAPDPDIITFLSLEQWQTAEDADIILTPEFFSSDIVDQESSPLFLSLPAVQEGRYVVLPAEVSQAAYLESTLSVRWVLPRLTDALLAAAEGNGKQLG